MLPHIFCCKKVCGFPPGILATLPKSSFSPPDSGLVMSIPSILLYIPVRVCYYNMVKRVQRLFSWQRRDFYSEQLHRNQEREGFPMGLFCALFNFPIAEFFVSSAFAESFVVTPLSRAVILSLTPPTV